MHWFIDPIKNHYADFDGRVGRQEFWMFVLFNFLLGIGLGIIGIDLLAMVIQLALAVPSLAIGARRLHDTGRSGWWQLLSFIPIIGWIILIIWLATKTELVDNTYGPPAVPKMGPEGVTPVAAVAPVATAMTDSTAPVTTPVNEKPEVSADTSADSSASTDGGSSSDGGGNSN
jgi:uncharacterized membrane protein YhaH (DUF805 family)